MYMEKINIDPYLTPIHKKINSKWIIGQSIKGKTIKLLEENKEGYFYDLEVERKLRHKTY